MKNKGIRYLTTAIVFGFTTLLLFQERILFGYEIPESSEPKVADNEDVKFLQRVSAGVATLSSHAKKGIVFVSIEKVVKMSPFGGQGNPFEFFFGPGFQMPNQGQQPPEQKQQGLGSGFFIDLAKGYILTNNHVIEDADQIHLKLANGKSYEGKVVGRDQNTDVAVVQIQGKFDTSGLESLGLGDSDKVKVGEFCIAAGAPFGLESSISLGSVSAIGRGSLSITQLGNFIQTDAAINPGNSGGPLLNTSGEVIGINTAIFSKSGAYNGIGFAIPANIVRTIATQLINKGKVERGFLGIELSDVDPELAEGLGLKKGTNGILIQSVGPGTPAEKGGLEAGDVVTKVDGATVENGSEFRSKIGLKKPGTQVSLTLIRNKREISKTVTLGAFQDAEKEAPSTPSNSDLGLAVSDASDALRKKFRFLSQSGAVVTKIEENSPAQEAGLKPGDVIVTVNTERVSGAKDFIKLTKGQKRFHVRVERQGRFLFLRVAY